MCWAGAEGNWEADSGAPLGSEKRSRKSSSDMLTSSSESS